MSALYTFDLETPQELMSIVAEHVQQRRLEKGLSRQALSEMSGVPTPTIAKFERQHTISMVQFVAIAKALGYMDQIKSLLSEPRYQTQQELETINKNKSRQRGRNVFH